MVFFPFLKLLMAHSATLDWRDRSFVKIVKEVGFRRTFTCGPALDCCTLQRQVGHFSLPHTTNAMVPGPPPQN
jgi:hypothetical protein